MSSSTEARVAGLAEKHLGLSSSDVDTNASELGVNSMDAVNFLKAMNEEFGSSVSPEDAANFSSLRELINHLDG